MAYNFWNFWLIKHKQQNTSGIVIPDAYVYGNIALNKFVEKFLPWVWLKVINSLFPILSI